MGTEIFDLRELIIMIKEKKELDANLALEFDCKLEVDDIKPLVKVFNYAINYILKIGKAPMHISLNAGGGGYKMAFTASTNLSEFPSVNPQVTETAKLYEAELTLDGEPGKFVQLQLEF